MKAIKSVKPVNSCDCDSVNKEIVKKVKKEFPNDEILGDLSDFFKVIGDEIRCTIYLANEWNIPQISLLGFVAPRYKKSDY